MDFFCEKCGAKLEKDCSFCTTCGAPVVNPVQGPTVNEKMSAAFDNFKAEAQVRQAERQVELQARQAEVEARRAEIYAQQQMTASKMADSTGTFVEPDEVELHRLGNGYAVNAFLFGSMKKVHATLTDKRVYFKGRMYMGTDIKSLSKITKTQIIDLEDVTGTGFIYNSFSLISLVISCILSLISMGVTIYGMAESGDIAQIGLIAFGVLLIPLIVNIVKYILSKRVYFFVEYAGGVLQFDAKLVGMADVADFHMQLRRAKENLKKKNR